jgi:hypothetical protein
MFLCAIVQPQTVDFYLRQRDTVESWTTNQSTSTRVITQLEQE